MDILILLICILSTKFNSYQFNKSSNDKFLFLIILIFLSNSNRNISNYSIKDNNIPSKITNHKTNYYKPTNHRNNKQNKTNNQKINKKTKFNDIKIDTKNKTNSTKTRDVYKKDMPIKINSNNQIHTSRKDNNKHDIEIKEPKDLIKDKVSKNPLTYTVIEGLQNNSEKVISNINSNSKIGKISISEDNKIVVNDIAYILNNNYRGVTVSILVRGLGIITGTIIFNFNSVVVLKLKNNITVFINKDAITSFY